MHDIPNYSGYNIPDYGGLLEYLTPEQQNMLDMSGSQLASHYGFGANEYGDYFNSFNKQGILDSLSELPELQQFGYNNARQSWIGGRDSLMNAMGQTGLASTGSFQNNWSDLNREMYNKMFQVDKSTQDIVNNLNTTVSDTLKNWQNTAMSLEQLDAQKDSGSSGGSGTVICTELHRQGFMSDKVYAKDAEFGKKQNDLVISGYHLFGKPLAKLMSKSKLVTSIVKPFALAWANDMAGNKNLVGSAINFIGIPICRILGKLRSRIWQYTLTQ